MEDFVKFGMASYKKQKVAPTQTNEVSSTAKQDTTAICTPVHSSDLSFADMPLKNDPWLSKDRLWSLIFWFGMSLGLSAGPLFPNQPESAVMSAFVVWTSIIAFPAMILIFNRTRFTKDGQFLNSQGTIITKKQLPYSFFIAAIAGVGFAFLIVETCFPEEFNTFLLQFIFFTCLLSGFCLYFIIKNCSISILFSLEFIGLLNKNSKTNTTHQSKSMNYYNELRHCAGKSYHPSNIYYSSTHRNR